MSSPASQEDVFPELEYVMVLKTVNRAKMRIRPAVCFRFPRFIYLFFNFSAA